MGPARLGGNWIRRVREGEKLDTPGFWLEQLGGQ